MHRRITSLLISICTLAALVVAAPAHAGAPPAIAVSGGGVFSTGHGWTSLAGSLPPGLRLARRLHPLNAGRRLDITVSLRLRNQPALARFLAAVYDPASPSYRHFLTVRQFKERFAPSQAARSGVAAWLRSRGLRITGGSSNGMQITARGSAGRLHAAFNTPLYLFRRNSRTFFANETPIRLPAALAPSVLSVAGLSTTARQRPASSARMRSRTPSDGYSPQEIQGVYDTAPLISQGTTGTGQTVAIAGFADYDPSDIAVFDEQYGLTAHVTRVKVSAGGSSGADLGESNGQDEAESDIEVMQGAAPGAAILMYEAPNNEQGTINMYDKIVSDNRAPVITTSWGGAESTYPNDELSAMDQSLQEGAAQGQAFFAASGDAGAFDAAGTGFHSESTLAVDFPASDPWVTGVGGTQLSSNGTQYDSETVWSDGSDPRNPTGTGGGLSTLFSLPSYQSGPGVANSFSNGERQVPDVAANADPDTGYRVFTVDTSNATTWGVIGGTSLSAPLWAGFATLLNQALGRPLGFLNPILYSLGQQAATFTQPPYHDVTQGTNLFYPATAGWDFATGWGSFDGAAFLADLRTIPLPTPVPTPPPTATPRPTRVPPSLTISKILLMHTVRGKLQPTGALKVGEKGTWIILYTTKRAGALKTFGHVLIRQKGQVLMAAALKKTTYQGKPALTTGMKFSNKSRVGTMLAHVTLTLGSVAAALDHTFKVVRAR